ncbi:hypothetical protein LX99_03369 [Mucilaginibacter oryzae]|uniref:Addiction module component n=1 Tax=Mucilaginibacter oryzae TaxID=468058 RepID=A0A316H814_9SPHI|nr:hypothetical protein [Mucilaginibacter oryzae]PWK76503.1 hypothetical protein LX99_03369 [Mucilaginibacter oryzae]
MDISVKYKMVEKIIQTQDDVILNEINSLLGLSDGDFWSDIPPLVQQAINKAKSQLDQGEGIPHEKVMEKIRSRFLNK